MKDQLNIILNEEKRRKSHEEASFAIKEAITLIKNHLKENWWFIDPLDITSSDILTYMHDKKSDKLTIHIKNNYIGVFLYNGTTLQIKNYQDLIEMLNIKEKNVYIPSGWFQFNSKPIIFQHTNLQLNNVFDAIGNFYIAYNILEPHAHIIGIWDNDLLFDLRNYINTIVKTIYESLMSLTELNFDSAQKSNEIYRELENKLIGKDNIDVILNELNTDICNRLSSIQQKIFPKY